MVEDSNPQDQLAAEAAALDGYFSDTPLEPEPNYPPLDEQFNRCVVISNLPKVPEAKLEKLIKVVTKLVSRVGALAAYDGVPDYTGFLMPKGADGITAGCAFVEYESAGDAKKAVEVLNEYKFDKNHVLGVTPYERARHLADTPEEYKAPEPEPHKERPNTMEWLEDSCQRDQYAIRHGKETAGE